MNLDEVGTMTIRNGNSDGRLSTFWLQQKSSEFSNLLEPQQYIRNDKIAYTDAYITMILAEQQLQQKHIDSLTVHNIKFQYSTHQSFTIQKSVR